MRWTEVWSVTCPYCYKPVKSEWIWEDNHNLGMTRANGAILLGDAIVHGKCFERDYAEYMKQKDQEKECPCQDGGSHWLCCTP